MIRRPPRSTRTDTLFPYTTLFRSNWRATWNIAMRSWDDVTNLGAPANSATAADYCPTPLPGKWLLFVSSRQNAEDCAGCKDMPPPPPGSPPHGDIFLTRENPASGWATPVDLGGYAAGGPNTRGADYSPSLEIGQASCWE